MKSYFRFSNKQRNGIFLLIVIIIALQLGYFFIDFKKNEPIGLPLGDIESYRAEVNALIEIQKEESKPKLYPFNPNFITDFKGYALGMSNEEIDRLHIFRAQNKWINSIAEFQEVTKVSDSLLDVISPYFKFPDWVNNSKPKPQIKDYSNSGKSKTFTQKKDLNLASAIELQKIYGIGEKLAQRIINYRNKFDGGFIADVELNEVWGLSTEVIIRLTNAFTVKTPRQIKKIDINTANRDDLVTIPYIDYEIAQNIIEERILREGFKSLDDLTKVEQFPINKLEIIKLYLHL